MRLFSRNQEEPLVGSFILEELRDLRKGMEGRDEQLRGEMSGIRGAVAELSNSLSRSQGDMGAIRQDVDKLTGDVHGLRVDLDTVKTERTTERVATESAWSGPKRVLAILLAVGMAATALTAIWKLTPLLVVFLTH